MDSGCVLYSMTPSGWMKKTGRWLALKVSRYMLSMANMMQVTSRMMARQATSLGQAGQHTCQCIFEA